MTDSIRNKSKSQNKVKNGEAKPRGVKREAKDTKHENFSDGSFESSEVMSLDDGDQLLTDKQL